MTWLTEGAPPRQRGGSATERAAEYLREKIATFELPPGASIDKAAICAELGLSRFPLTEALNRLKAEGLVDVKPQSGTSVARIRLVDARENMFLRRTLEGEVAAQVAALHSAPLRTELRRVLRFQKAAAEAMDRAGFHRHDLAFHDLLVDALGYRRVRSAIEAARLGLDRVRRLLQSPRRHAHTYAEHEAIVNALERGDPEGARRAMHHHLDAVWEELILFAAERPMVFADLDALGPIDRHALMARP